MKKKRFLAFLAAGAIATVGLTGCSGEKETQGSASINLPVDDKGNPGPFGKYEETVTTEIIQYINPTVPIPEGDSVTDNYYTRYIKDNINIDIRVKWSAVSTDYAQKLDLAIASNDLPDIMVVNEAEFRRMVKMDLLEDLTDYYDAYASDAIKDIIDATKGRALDMVSVDGRLYALPNVQSEADGYNVMWIRMDWLKELRLKVPRTMEELRTVAKAFVEHDMGGKDTIGILAPTVNHRLYNDFTSSTNNMNNLDGIFQAYRSWPGFWIEGEDGQAVYGSVTPETKEALGELQSMYKEGILDAEIGVRKESDEAWKSGKAGILFSPWWHGYNVKDCLDKDPQADWQAFAGPLAEDGRWYPKQGGVGISYCVARKGYEHPEVVFLLNNFLHRDERKISEETDLNSGYYPGRVSITPYDTSSVSVEMLHKRMNGEQALEYDSEQYSLLEHDLETLEACLKPPYGDLSIEHWDMSPIDSGRVYSLLKGFGCVVDAKNEGIVDQTYSLIYSQTETMEEKWEALKKMEDAIFLKIIIGELPLEAFDDFVQAWKTGGGDEITAEVQEINAGN